MDKIRRKLRYRLLSGSGRDSARDTLRHFRDRNPLDLRRPSAAGFIGFSRWIPEHSDVLIARIRAAAPQIELADVELFRDPHKPDSRTGINRAAEYDPVVFRQACLARLVPLQAAGLRALVFTLDWNPAMRELVHACRSLGLATVLVPHESVFAHEERYYSHPRTMNRAPLCDGVLAWGALQAEIFQRRHYPGPRIATVGSPKLDHDATYRPQTPPAAFRAMHALPPERPMVLFASQPMDSFGDTREARAAQAAAIRDTFEHCREHGLSLMLRQPPSRDRILDEALEATLLDSGFCTIDRAGSYLASPEESMAQAAAVVSVNSTMLFEARLMGVPSVAARYLDFPSIWDAAEIPAARDRAGLHAALDAAIGHSVPPANAWAVRSFTDGVHGFDGRSTTRIAEALERVLQAPPQQLRISALAPTDDDLRPNTVAVGPELGDIDSRLAAAGVGHIVRPETEAEAAAADSYVLKRGDTGSSAARFARALGRTVEYVD